ncbi:hypothetical protein ON010_g10937 [Phytophthora cinnamomi]|nr:hypothetical protein ON010_g10937 [Phytophthora cinnamomi]
MLGGIYRGVANKIGKSKNGSQIDQEWYMDRNNLRAPPSPLLSAVKFDASTGCATAAAPHPSASTTNNALRHYLGVARGGHVGAADGQRAERQRQRQREAAGGARQRQRRRHPDQRPGQAQEDEGGDEAQGGEGGETHAQLALHAAEHAAQDQEKGNKARVLGGAVRDAQGPVGAGAAVPLVVRDGVAARKEISADTRSSVGKPSFLHFFAMPSADLLKLLLQAYDKQMEVLVEHEGPDTSLLKDLQKERASASRIDPDKADRSVRKVLKEFAELEREIKEVQALALKEEENNDEDGDEDDDDEDDDDDDD